MINISETFVYTVFSDKVTVVRYVEGGSDPSDPTLGELLKIDKAEDKEFKD